MKAVSWHKTEKGTVSAPLIIDPTAGGLTVALKLACNKYKEATGIEVKVLLRAGASVGSDAKSEPLRGKACGRQDCLCCSTGHPGGCERNSVGYRITCQACQGAGSWAQYEGESGRNAYSRGLEHQQDLWNEKEDSSLWKHCQLQHEGVKQTFYMEALRSFSSCLARQINEAVRISSSSATIIMNSKSEFHQAPIVRVMVSSGLELEQGEEAPQRGRGRGAGRGRGRAGSGVGRGAGGERQMRGRPGS